MFLVYKYTQYRRLNHDQHKTKQAERELHSLNHKIDKLLLRLEDFQPERFKPGDDECVVCLNASATMKTLPCGHKVVCRKCFVKTIQVAIKERSLPLKCVVCRERIIQLVPSREMLPLTPPPSRRHIKFPWQHDSGTNQETASRDYSTRSSSSARTVVATKVMQPWLIHPERASRPSGKSAVKYDVAQTQLHLPSGGDTAASEKSGKKRVYFPSPVRTESPPRKPGTGCCAARKILKNSAVSRIPTTLKYSECFSPRLARAIGARNT